MAVTIDTTVGGPSANSYASQAEVDAYAEASSYATTWAGAGASKPALIVRACKLLNIMAFPGDRVDATQALPWPRFGVDSPDGGSYASTIIPPCVKNAQAELAAWLSSTSDDPSLDPFLGLDSLGLGALTLTPDTRGRTSPVQDFLARVVAPILRAGLCLGPAGAVRLVR